VLKPIANNATLNDVNIITSTQVTNNGQGYSLPNSQGDGELSIVHTPNEGNREIGDGTENAQLATPQDDNIPSNLPLTNKKKKRIKANTKITSLNMKGRYHDGEDKWIQIRDMIRTEKIGILALQETHLTEREEDELNIKFENDWKIISSIDPNHTNAAGVAFVLNKKLANTEGIIKQNMAAGRALQITIPWRKDIKLTLLNIYAPNNATENETFWNDLKNKIPDDKKPDVLLGDFNLVKDALDKLPAHRDHAGATTALSDPKAHLHLKDGWCHINPDTKNYTY